jgi:oxygen-independent coproporphyrinogen-3 oxidase
MMNKQKNKWMNIRKTTNKDLDCSSLYIHIPFCNHICSYCDFAKIFYDGKFAFLYSLKIIDEIKHLILIKKKFRTIYFGGGTPSCLPNYVIDAILTYVEKLIDKSKKYEVTFEMNIESIDEDKLNILKKHNVNRISVGVQTFNDEILKKLNRFHTGEEAIKKIELVKKYFTNFNIDIIYGMPFSIKYDIMNDLVIVDKLKPTHVSLYSLQINKGTMLFNDGYKELDQDTLANEYYKIVRFLRLKGYRRYEVSNFAQKGFESQHNITYWRDKHYMAIGLGSSGYLKNQRFSFTKDIKAYIFGNGNPIFETISRKNDFEYYLLTNLRLAKGFSIIEINKKFKINFIEKYKEPLTKLKNLKLICVSKNRVKCSYKGLYLLDGILVELLNN